MVSLFLQKCSSPRRIYIVAFIFIFRSSITLLHVYGTASTDWCKWRLQADARQCPSLATQLCVTSAHCFLILLIGIFGTQLRIHFRLQFYLLITLIELRQNFKITLVNVIFQFLVISILHVKITYFLTEHIIF